MLSNQNQLNAQTAVIPGSKDGQKRFGDCDVTV